MRAAVYHGNGRITVDELPRPTVGPGELLIQIHACGLCGSDLMRWYQDPRAPVVLGHEPVGTVVEAGVGAPIGVGTRVFVHHHVPCMVCTLCRRGRHTLCETFRATRIDPGGFAEFIRVPAANARLDVFEVPQGMSDAAATLIEPLACILRGQRMAGVVEGSRVAVVGAGSMGLLEIACATALGAGSVVAIEPRADRRAHARRFGALAPDEAADALALERADAVFVCTHDHRGIQMALDLAAAAGVVQLFAPTEPGELVPLDLGAIFFREVTIQSTYSAGPFDTRDACELLTSGAVDAESIISHRVPLAQIAEAFRLARSGEAVKVLVEISPMHG
jgi:L-iditol 2-dehydrogenase